MDVVGVMMMMVEDIMNLIPITIPELHRHGDYKYKIPGLGVSPT